MTFNEAIRAVRDECPNEAAKAYAAASMRAATEFGMMGLVSQARYVLCNIQYWRNPQAKKIRDTLKEFIKRHKE